MKKWGKIVVPEYMTRHHSGSYLSLLGKRILRSFEISHEQFLYFKTSFAPF